MCPTQVLHEYELGHLQKCEYKHKEAILHAEIKNGLSFTVKA